jgi:hypothetical protein
VLRADLDRLDALLEAVGGRGHSGHAVADRPHDQRAH